MGFSIRYRFFENEIDSLVMFPSLSKRKFCMNFQYRKDLWIKATSRMDSLGCFVFCITLVCCASGKFYI